MMQGWRSQQRALSMSLGPGGLASLLCHPEQVTFILHMENEADDAGFGLVGTERRQMR